MKPIINPAIIYVINLMGSLRVGLIVAAVIFAVLTIFCAINYLDMSEGNSEEDKQSAKDFFRFSKRFLVCFALSFIRVWLIFWQLTLANRIGSVDTSQKAMLIR